MTTADVELKRFLEVDLDLAPSLLSTGLRWKEERGGRTKSEAAAAGKV